MVQRNEENRQERERLTVWYPEYFVVYTGIGSYLVSRETARQIERALARPRLRRWVRFVDVSGAAIRLQTALVRSLEQSTPETRELARRMSRERSEEHEDERWN